MAAFYASNEKDVELGLDIEYMKPRDFEKLLKYYQVETDVYDAKNQKKLHEKTAKNL